MEHLALRFSKLCADPAENRSGIGFPGCSNRDQIAFDVKALDSMDQFADHFDRRKRWKLTEPKLPVETLVDLGEWQWIDPGEHPLKHPKHNGVTASGDEEIAKGKAVVPYRRFDYLTQIVILEFRKEVPNRSKEVGFAKESSAFGKCPDLHPDAVEGDRFREAECFARPPDPFNGIQFKSYRMPVPVE